MSRPESVTSGQSKATAAIASTLMATTKHLHPATCHATEREPSQTTELGEYITTHPNDARGSVLDGAHIGIGVRERIVRTPLAEM